MLAYGALVSFPFLLDDVETELQIVVHVVMVEVINCVVVFEEEGEIVDEFDEDKEGAKEVDGEVDILSEEVVKPGIMTDEHGGGGV